MPHALSSFRRRILLWLVLVLAPGTLTAQRVISWSGELQGGSAPPGVIWSLSITWHYVSEDANNVTWDIEFLAPCQIPNEGTQWKPSRIVAQTEQGGSIIAVTQGPAQKTRWVVPKSHTTITYIAQGNIWWWANMMDGLVASFPNSAPSQQGIKVVFLNQTQGLAWVFWEGGGPGASVPKGAQTEYILMTDEPPAPQASNGKLGVAPSYFIIEYQQDIPEPEGGWVWDAATGAGRKWTPEATRTTHQRFGPFTSDDASNPLREWKFTIAANGEHIAEALGSGEEKEAELPGGAAGDNEKGVLAKYTAIGEDGTPITPPLQNAPASYANASPGEKAIIDAQLSIEQRAALRAQQQANQMEALIRAVRGSGGGGGGTSVNMKGVETRLDTLNDAVGGYMDGVADALEDNPTTGEMQGEGQQAAANERAILGTAPKSAPATGSGGSMPNFSVQLPAAFSGAAFNFNPFTEDRLGIVASWFRAAMQWTTLVLLGTYLWGQMAEWVRGLSTVRQAQGNAVVGGTGAQATALVAAGLITAAVVVAMTALMSWSIGSVDFAAITGALGTSPAVTMPAGALWMLDQLFPVATMVTAFVARVTFPWYGSTVFATCAAVVRFVVP